MVIFTFGIRQEWKGRAGDKARTLSGGPDFALAGFNLRDLIADGELQLLQPRQLQLVRLWPLPFAPNQVLEAYVLPPQIVQKALGHGRSPSSGQSFGAGSPAAGFGASGSSQGFGFGFQSALDGKAGAACATASILTGSVAAGG